MLYNKNGPAARRLRPVWLGLSTALVALFPMVVLAAGADNCAECHDEVVEAFNQTSHGVYFSGDAGVADACASCHGSGLAHIEEGGDPELIINPSKHDQFGDRELCLNCHNDRQYDDWSFSAHAGADVGCSSCHTVHSNFEKSLKSSTPKLCYDCHPDVRAAVSMPSHHPIAEGKMECQDCHSIHGGQASFAMEDRSRELCFSCHAEMEGPFIYEHAPVTEDCGVCHQPHGSVADNLLVQSEPTLCLSCHAMHFHTIGESVPGDFETPQAPERAGTSTLDSWKSGMLTKCTQCHTGIHGSDMPSQTISTGGNALTR